MEKKSGFLILRVAFYEMRDKRCQHMIILKGDFSLLLKGKEYLYKGGNYIKNVSVLLVNSDLI